MNEDTVKLDRTDWLRICAAMSNSVKELENEHEAERLDELIDEIIGQAEITIAEIMELNAELATRP